jgi:hypothetical protein
MPDNVIELKFTWLEQILIELPEKSTSAETSQEIADLLCDLDFLTVICQKLKTETAIHGFLQECLDLFSTGDLAAHPKLNNMSKYLEHFSACLDIYNSGWYDEGASCVECGQHTIIHGHTDRGGVDFYDNYISWCTNCYWAWHREDYAMSGSEGPISAFNYKTNKYD